MINFIRKLSKKKSFGQTETQTKAISLSSETLSSSNSAKEIIELELSEADSNNSMETGDDEDKNYSIQYPS